MPPTIARIALVSTYYAPVVGGAEAAAERLARYLAAEGRTIFVLTKRTSRAHPEYETIDGVPVWRRPPAGARSALGKWLFLPWVVGGLIARRAAYDVVVVVDQRGTGLAVRLVARLLGKPFVIQPQTQGTLDGRHPQKTGWRDLLHRAVSRPFRLAYARADAVACISQSIVAEGRSLGIDPARLVYLPNPVGSRFYEAMTPDERAAGRRALGLTPEDVVFLYTGRLSREKGLLELVSAWTAAVRPGMRLLVVGPDMDGHPWNVGPDARAQVARAGLEASVQFLGRRSHDEVAALMHLADVAVLPSHFEAHPVAGVEAMACGLPLIASNVGGVPDFVRDGGNGRLVPARDIEALAHALADAAADPVWRARAAAAARETARAFSEGEVLARFAHLIDRVAARSPVDPPAPA